MLFVINKLNFIVGLIFVLLNILVSWLSKVLILIVWYFNLSVLVLIFEKFKMLFKISSKLLVFWCIIVNFLCLVLGKVWLFNNSCVIFKMLLSGVCILWFIFVKNCDLVLLVWLVSFIVLISLFVLLFICCLSLVLKFCNLLLSCLFLWLVWCKWLKFKVSLFVKFENWVCNWFIFNYVLGKWVLVIVFLGLNLFICFVNFNIGVVS